MPKRKREPKCYAMLPRRYTTQALVVMGFQRDGPAFVRRGACRALLAEATSIDGVWWRIRPYVRSWR